MQNLRQLNKHTTHITALFIWVIIYAVHAIYVQHELNNFKIKLDLQTERMYKVYDAQQAIIIELEKEYTKEHKTIILDNIIER